MKSAAAKKVEKVKLEEIKAFYEHNFLKDTRRSLEVYVVSTKKWEQFNSDLEKRQKSNSQVQIDLDAKMAEESLADAKNVSNTEEMAEEGEKSKEIKIEVDADKKKDTKKIDKEHLNWKKWPKISGVYEQTDEIKEALGEGEGKWLED
jgi:ribosomal protein S8